MKHTALQCTRKEVRCKDDINPFLSSLHTHTAPEEPHAENAIVSSEIWADTTTECTRGGGECETSPPDDFSTSTHLCIIVIAPPTHALFSLSTSLSFSLPALSVLSQLTRGGAGGGNQYGGMFSISEKVRGLFRGSSSWLLSVMLNPSCCHHRTLCYLRYADLRSHTHIYIFRCGIPVQSRRKQRKCSSCFFIQ